MVSAVGLARAISFVVAAEDVERGKPDPEGYLRGLRLLPAGTAPSDVLVLEDSEAGIAAAKTAGMHVVAVTGTLPPERLRAADELAESITPELLRRYVAQPKLPA